MLRGAVKAVHVAALNVVSFQVLLRGSRFPKRPFGCPKEISCECQLLNGSLKVAAEAGPSVVLIWKGASHSVAVHVCATAACTEMSSEHSFFLEWCLEPIMWTKSSPRRPRMCEEADGHACWCQSSPKDKFPHTITREMQVFMHIFHGETDRVIGPSFSTIVQLRGRRSRVEEFEKVQRLVQNGTISSTVMACMGGWPGIELIWRSAGQGQGQI
ncbi:uncharacterized protein IWZ02DRAFT_83580 [Phyllosticta citriasiana]|uniref:Uncharacterized protein n=1 Tax=Phyllosticta citriasiana TaxID=595635 RepID=A0ABR1KM71_9PEZI